MLSSDTDSLKIDADDEADLKTGKQSNWFLISLSSNSSELGQEVQYTRNINNTECAA